VNIGLKTTIFLSVMLIQLQFVKTSYSTNQTLNELEDRLRRTERFLVEQHYVTPLLQLNQYYHILKTFNTFFIFIYFFLTY